MIRRPPRSTRTDTLFPYTTLFRSDRGWVLTLSGQSQLGLSSLIDAATTDPEYPDVHAFLAIVFFRNGMVQEASRELDRFDALDPPASIRQLTEELRTQIDAALAEPTPEPTTTTAHARPRRSEENTSEPQSLLRHSNADFCLQKKKI